MLYYIYRLPLWIIMLLIIILPILRGIVGRRSIFGSRLFNLLLSLAAGLLILWVTVIRRSPGSGKGLILMPFDSFARALEQPEYYREMLMNVLLFLPLGLFLPFVFERRGVLRAVIIGTGLAVIIEAVQLLFSLGLAETDDVLANALGCFLGAASVWVTGLADRLSGIGSRG